MAVVKSVVKIPKKIKKKETKKIMSHRNKNNLIFYSIDNYFYLIYSWVSSWYF